MRYTVRARPRIGEMGRLWSILNDGTVARQEPDGGEIIASMKRARITRNGVEWTETCYCNPPLQHERSTVYDQFFEGMEIGPLEVPSKGDGERFWDHLKGLSEGSLGAPANRVLRVHSDTFLSAFFERDDFRALTAASRNPIISVVPRRFGRV